MTRKKTPASRLYFRVCCFVLYFVAAAASFNGFYDKWHFGEWDLSGETIVFHFEMMVDGTAIGHTFTASCFRPRPTGSTGPCRIRLRPGSITSRPPGPGAIDAIFDSSTAENPAYFFRLSDLYASTFLFTLLAVYAMYLLCRAHGGSSNRGGSGARRPHPSVSLYPERRWFLYDYPELAFFALAAWAALKFDWWTIIPLAALGTWNKETFLLFIPALYPFIRQRSSRLGAWSGSPFLAL